MTQVIGQGQLFVGKTYHGVGPLQFDRQFDRLRYEVTKVFDTEPRTFAVKERVGGMTKDELAQACLDRFLAELPILSHLRRLAERRRKEEEQRHLEEAYPYRFLTEQTRTALKAMGMSALSMEMALGRMADSSRVTAQEFNRITGLGQVKKLPPVVVDPRADTARALMAHWRKR